MSYEAIVGIQSIMLACIAWLLKVAYERNGCMKRLEGYIKTLEQKIDSFIKYHEDT